MPPAVAELRVLPVLDTPTRRVVAIAEVTTSHGRGEDAAWLSATLAPVAVVVREGDHRWAIDLDNRPLPLDDLRRRVPALDKVLDAG